MKEPLLPLEERLLEYSYEYDFFHAVRLLHLILTDRPGSDLPPYQRLLGDAMQGIRDLFTRQDLVDAQWRIVDAVLDNVTPLHGYERGCWGPAEAAELIGADGPWHDPKPGKAE